MVEFEFLGHPPSTNSLFYTIGRRRVKTAEYRAWEAKVERVVRGYKFGLKSLAQFNDKPFALEINVFQDSWIQKNRMAVKKPDIDNMLKALIDATCKISGWKDQNAVSIHIAKVEAPGPLRTQIIFKFIDSWYAPNQ